jgi:hypothetical protein
MKNCRAGGWDIFFVILFFFININIIADVITSFTASFFFTTQVAYAAVATRNGRN